MARTKSQSPADPSNHIPSTESASKPQTGSHRSSALTIARNKHWRYISNYHGPWLQLPTELLETIAYTNWTAPRPCPIDPATLFDLLKIRKCVDEATDLAVRAASGMVASQSQALGIGGNGSKLSRERKHRIRELATAKLANAYRLDEIAASVAMMQSTSTLEDIAALVLQRNQQDRDARYVNFFHEKIPSRRMAEFTPLTILNDIIALSPMDPCLYRTRALTRIFHTDLAGAIQDFTTALRLVRQAKGPQHLDPALNGSYAAFKADIRNGQTLDDKYHPSSLEQQLLFQRANIYFRVACQEVNNTLDAKRATGNATEGPEVEISPESRSAQQRYLELRKAVKTNANKALRDYTAFLEKLDYTPGSQHGCSVPDNDRLARSEQCLPQITNGHASDDHIEDGDNKPATIRRTNSDISNMQLPKVYQVSQLFTPSNIASSMASTTAQTSTELVLRDSKASERLDQKINDIMLERVTCHPLLSEALHSLLLCHALVQTPPTELQRYALNAARLLRIVNPYPVFLHAKSNTKGDWNEVLRLTRNWIDLNQSWTVLCRSNHPSKRQEAEESTLSNISLHPNFKNLNSEQRKNVVAHKAMMEALADERVFDENTFREAVTRRKSAFNQQQAASSNNTVKAIEGSKDHREDSISSELEFPGFSTERAEAIARWVLEAPVSIEGIKSKRAKKKSKNKTAEHDLQKMSLSNEVSIPDP